MTKPSSHTTIAAIATPPGIGAIAMVRMSGPDAFPIAERLFSGPVTSYPSHTAHYGHILSSSNESIDAVLLIVMKGPKSYTGEDSVEICCHGSDLIATRVLQRLFEEGAVPATPGEFSFRAFINGKIDLAQAEAVQQMIVSQSAQACRMAEQQLSGHLSKTIRTFQEKLTDLAAIFEAHVDFPEEGLELTTKAVLQTQLHTTLQAMRKLKETFHEGRPLHAGLKMALIGTPNVGKSSLMNTLLGKERAIVTPIPGTTRDFLEEPLILADIPFRLIDTAGIRTTDDTIEAIGIERSLTTFEEADLIFLLLDTTRPLSLDDHMLLDRASPDKTILLWNKVDLQKAPGPLPRFPHQVPISATTREGLDELRQTLETLLFKQGPPSKEQLWITQERHFLALQEAILPCERALQSLQQHRAEFELLAADMRESLQALASILGVNVTEMILSSIFKQFCLGK
jgi:tRNA modification GTPase